MSMFSTANRTSAWPKTFYIISINLNVIRNQVNVFVRKYFKDKKYIYFNTCTQQYIYKIKLIITEQTLIFEFNY